VVDAVALLAVYDRAHPRGRERSRHFELLGCVKLTATRSFETNQGNGEGAGVSSNPLRGKRASRRLHIEPEATCEWKDKIGLDGVVDILRLLDVQASYHNTDHPASTVD
jgi:hypothetical protein